MKEVSSIAALSCLLSVFACCSSPSQKDNKPAAEASVAPANDSENVPRARVAYYQPAFPTAKSFNQRKIPSEMLRTSDQGNDTFVEARDAQGKLLGYLRDFTGPVSPNAACACNPLNLTLVFGTDYALRTIIAPAPLQKLGHAEMSAAELTRLIEIARNPAPELLAPRHIEDVVDATTGATKPELKPFVVGDAALSTKRIATLVQDTKQILQGTKLGLDKKRLDALVEKQMNEAGLAHALAEFLPSAESPDVQLFAFRLMTQAYTASLERGGTPDLVVENRWLDPGLGTASQASEILAACYGLASIAPKQPFAARCAKEVSATDAQAKAERNRLLGTLALAQGDAPAAVTYFKDAAGTFDLHADAAMHLRLAQALGQSGNRVEACTQAQKVVAVHPLLPGAKEALAACGDAEAIAKALDTQLRQLLLKHRLEGSTAAPKLQLEGPNFEAVDLDFANSGKVTVLMFFATWCPHCQAEMPRVVEFASRLAQHPEWKDKVQVIGVRTAVERETEPYEAFAQRFKINFPVWIDSTMSVAFSRFAKAAGITPGLPTLAVLDKRGVVRYLLDPGDYKDTTRELEWAVGSLL